MRWETEVSVEPRLIEHRKVVESGCWEWARSRFQNGYGRISFRGRVERTHRVAAHLAFGMPLDSALVVCHKCDNPPCFNPAHLFIGSQSDNMQDAASKGRTYRPRRHEVCRKGHPLDGGNVYQRKGGQRRCRKCLNDYQRRRRAESDLRKSSTRGVHFDRGPGRWTATHKKRRVGSFPTEGEAIVALKEHVRAIESALGGGE